MSSSFLLGCDNHFLFIVDSQAEGKNAVSWAEEEDEKCLQGMDVSESEKMEVMAKVRPWKISIPLGAASSDEDVSVIGSCFVG